MAETVRNSRTEVVQPALSARERVAARSRPQQDRSKARLAALLNAAEELVVEVGLDGLRMREVARRADLPIASVYHYFPSTAALVRAMAVRNLATTRELIYARFGGPEPSGTTTVTIEAAHGVVDDIAAHMMRAPAVPALWNGLRSNPDLRQLDVEDTRRNAAFLAPIILRTLRQGPGTHDLSEAMALAMVLNECVVAGLLLAYDSPSDERPDLIAALKRLVTAVIPDGPGAPAPGKPPRGAARGRAI